MVMLALQAMMRGGPIAFRGAQFIGGRGMPQIIRQGARALTSRPATYGGLGFGAASLFGGGLPSLGGGGGGAPAGATAEVAYSWDTGTATFYRLANGKIGTMKKNGVWKEWRPYRPVVIPKRWKASSMNRVASALDRQQDTAIKIVKMAGGDASKTKRRAPAKEPMYAKGATQIVRAG